MSSSNQGWFRLEFTAVTRRKANGPLGYGYVLFEQDTGSLVATGCGPVARSVTFNQAAHIALLEGLKVAVAHGARRVLLHCDSNPSLNQVTRSRPALGSAPLVEARDLLDNQLRVWKAKLIDRRLNSLAVLHAEFAAELHGLLLKVAAAPPSRYGSVAGQLALLLQLPISVRRWLEGADDFLDATAQVVAVRCGTSKDDVLATLINKDSINTAQTSSSKPDSSSSSSSMATEPVGSDQGSTDSAAVSATAGASKTDGLLHPRVCFHMQRVFSPQEGAAYAAAAVKAEADAAANIEAMKAAQGEGTTDHEHDAPTAAAAAAGSGSSSRRRRAGSDKNSDDAASLDHGRVVGRHRMSHRLLVVGLHSMPPDWAGQPLLPPPQQQQQPPPAQDVDAEATSTTAAAAGPLAAVSTDVLQAEISPEMLGDSLIKYWMGRKRAGGAEGVGLGSARYNLPQVQSDTATHLLQFDGASRNNPGRGGYGYVIFDITTAQVVQRGCMSLPYGATAGRAEFEGLIAGLEAAVKLGIKQLAVQGDSSVVLDTIMYRRGTGNRNISVNYQKTTQLLTQFDHVDFQYIPRQQNSIADRLANISMDIDTALYAVLRRGAHDKDALRTIVKAAKINKKQEVLELLLEAYDFPLLLCVLLDRVMCLSPAQLLDRLETKAAHMGDPNPILVQGVRKVVKKGIPADVMSHIGAAMMDSRYSRMDMARLRKEAAAVRQQQPQQTGILLGQQQQEQRRRRQLGHVRQYSHMPEAAALGWRQRRAQEETQQHMQQQQWQQLNHVQHYSHVSEAGDNGWSQQWWQQQQQKVPLLDLGMQQPSAPFGCWQQQQQFVGRIRGYSQVLPDSNSYPLLQQQPTLQRPVRDLSFAAPIQQQQRQQISHHLQPAQAAAEASWHQGQTQLSRSAQLAWLWGVSSSPLNASDRCFADSQLQQLRWLPASVVSDVSVSSLYRLLFVVKGKCVR